MRRLFPKCLWALLAVVPLAGCGAPGAPQPPSLELPKPVTDLRAVRKGDKVYLSWTVPSETTDRQTVRHLGATRICRGLEAGMKECGTPVAEAATPQPTPPSTKAATKTVVAPPKIQGSYTDTLSSDVLNNFPRSISYAIVVPNDDGKGAGLSNRVQVPAVPTLPPPSDFKALVTADGVVLSWTSASNGQDTPEWHYVYRVYRRMEAGKTGGVIGEVPMALSYGTEFVDHSFEWTKTYYYRATVVTVISSTEGPGVQIEGDDTPEVKVSANDVFPPAVPSGLQAVFSGPGQQAFVDLIWAPDIDADLAGYNIYRHEEGEQPVKLNPTPVATAAFRDSGVVSGRKYFYWVSAVDVRGNESGRSEEAGEDVP